MNMQYLSVRDIKLLYAEALADAGQLSEAMTQVNDVRRRAALDVNIIKLENGQAPQTIRSLNILYISCGFHKQRCLYQSDPYGA